MKSEGTIQLKCAFHESQRIQARIAVAEFAGLIKRRFDKLPPCASAARRWPHIERANLANIVGQPPKRDTAARLILIQGDEEAAIGRNVFAGKFLANILIR